VNTIRRAMSLVLLLLLATNALAQSQAITGVVIDSRTRTPLAHVPVTVEGHSVTATTDEQGRFSLAMPAGDYVLVISVVGYSVARNTVSVTTGSQDPIIIELSEGAGAFSERVEVTANKRGFNDASSAPAAVAIHGRDLQALRGVILDDPLRAAQALPSASSTDDFYGEFAVRGSSFRHISLVVDGIPSRYLTHAVHGVTDGGSIAMINSDAMGALHLSPGSYAQSIGRRLGAQLDISIRDGSREGFTGRVGLSGTSATGLAEGPLSNRGSWLVSVRRSYLDLLLKRLDTDANLAFGFSDVLGKVSYDVTPTQQLQILTIAGKSGFDESGDDLAVNDEATSDGQTWLAAVTWRITPSARFTIAQRVFSTGLSFHNRNLQRDTLDRNTSTDLGWRADATWAIAPWALIDVGADLQRFRQSSTRRRALNDAASLAPVAAFDARTSASSAYVRSRVALGPRVSIQPGVRVDAAPVSHAVTTSPWMTSEISLTARTRVRLGGGVYRQFPELSQVYGVNGGGRALQSERARHFDLGIAQELPLGLSLQTTWWTRVEDGVLWTPDAEPRRDSAGIVQLGRGDAPWTNALNGDAHGVEVMLRRDAPSGLAGWIGYAYGKHRYTEIASGRSFWADADQRHAVSAYGHYRLTDRASLGAKFRYGSNYPRIGYFDTQSFASNAPPLFGGDMPVFVALGDQRNTLRLPAYARLDVRADRTFNVGRRRITLFVEVANALNRRNLRNVPYGVERNGRVAGGTDAMLPILPSAGFVIEF
jgi:hypothetical protein